MSTGPNYSDSEVFDMETMQPYTMRDLYMPYSSFTPDFVLYLPRSADLNQVARYAKESEQLQVVHYCMRGASKAICVFFGAFPEVDQS